MWLFGLHAAALAGCTAAGLVVGRRRRRVWLPVALAAVALALASAALRWYGDLVPPLVAWADYPLIEGWHLPVGLLGVGTLVRHLPRRQTRRLVYVAGAVILAYGFWSAAMRFLVTFGDLSGRPDGRGLCPQTSNYSCGAAALSTWLAQLGVTADERDLARLTVTQRFGGASPLGLLRAARIRLAGHPVRPVLRRLSWDQLASLKRPCVIVVRHSLLVDHYVTVLGVERERVNVADPLWSGVAVWSRRELEDRWRRIALVAEEAVARKPLLPGQSCPNWGLCCGLRMRYHVTRRGAAGPFPREAGGMRS